MKREDYERINAILAVLDAGADGGDVALADLPRTRYQPAGRTFEQAEAPLLTIPRLLFWSLVGLALWVLLIVTPLYVFARWVVR